MRENTRGGETFLVAPVSSLVEGNILVRAVTMVVMRAMVGLSSMAGVVGRVVVAAVAVVVGVTIIVRAAALVGVSTKVGTGARVGGEFMSRGCRQGKHGSLGFRVRITCLVAWPFLFYLYSNE